MDNSMLGDLDSIPEEDKSGNQQIKRHDANSLYIAFPDLKRYTYTTFDEDACVARECTLTDLLDYFLAYDLNEELVKEINGLRCKEEVPSDFLERMYMLDAAKCSMAVLNGETSGIFDVNATFYDSNKESPLHKAAYYSSHKMMELFLENGANPDARCECDHSGMKGMLPLDVVLLYLRQHKTVGVWTLKESIFKLIYRLCDPDLRDTLETVRLLAQKMKGIEKEIFSHAKDGNLVELTTLLMVAREKVLSLSVPERIGLDGKMKLRDYVLAEVASLQFLSCSATGCNKSVKELKYQRAKMEAVLLLLEVFERMGQSIEAYLRLDPGKFDYKKMAMELAWLFEVAGYDVKCDLLDDKTRAQSNTEIQVPWIVKLPGPSPFYGSRKMSEWNPKKHERFPDPDVSLAFCMSSKMRWFHTSRSSKTGAIPEPAIQVKKVGFKVSNLQFGRYWLAVLRRGIRHA